MRTLLFRGACVALAASLVGHASAAIVIDQFNTNQTVTIPFGGPNPTSAQGGVAAPGAVGGARWLQLTRVDGDGGASLQVVIEQGRINFDAAAAGTALFRYDGNTNGTLEGNGLGSLDLTQGGVNNQFILSVRSDLVAPGLIRVYTGNGNFSEATFNLPGNGFGGTPFTDLVIPFAAFTVENGTGATFNNIGAIELFIDGSDVFSLDVQIDRFDVIPEPSSLVAMSGALALALLRRR